jgi:hypothetical protein
MLGKYCGEVKWVDSLQDRVPVLAFIMTVP